MDQQNFVKAMTFLADSYRSEITKRQVNAWYQYFAGETDANFRKAIMRWTEKSRFMPSIADLKAEIAGLTDPWSQLSPEEGWNEVKHAISKYGYYNAEEAENSFGPLTKETVKRMGGFRAICLMTDDGWPRKNFIKTWEEMRKNQANIKAMDENVMTAAELKRIQIKPGELPAPE